MGDRVFTGDTLLIRGTGRTDFQRGDARAQYESIFGRLLKLPDETLVYPGHDYKGDTVSTILEERQFNPRLQVSSVDEYVEIMDNLNLPNPKMMAQSRMATISRLIALRQQLDDGVATEKIKAKIAKVLDDFIGADLSSAGAPGDEEPEDQQAVPRTPTATTSKAIADKAYNGGAGGN